MPKFDYDQPFGPVCGMGLSSCIPNSFLWTVQLCTICCGQFRSMGKGTVCFYFIIDPNGKGNFLKTMGEHVIYITV